MYESFRSRLEETTLALRTKELERERALKLATEAQLASLESRIHPHFLFNTLNSISSLIPEDPKRAEQLVERMAALLRFSLDANHSGLVPLEREMKIVSDYLAIEQARFGDRLRFQIDVPPELGESKVPPLAIQTLVENSVKHAVARSRSGGEIRVALARDNGSLRIEVRDEGPEFALDAAPSGHGLDILKGRLVALFGQQAGLALERSGNRNQITLSVHKRQRTCERFWLTTSRWRSSVCSRMLAATKRVEIVGQSSDPEQAVSAIRTAKPDVLFLDIEMPGMTGFEMLSRIEPQPLIVFTTAYGQYALEAFGVNSIDYLLKPIEAAQLDRAIDKIERMRGGAEPRPEVKELLARVAALANPAKQHNIRIASHRESASASSSSNCRA